MELKLTKQTKEIKKTREHSISIKNIGNGGSDYDFSFRTVEEHGEVIDLLFPFGKNKWSKTPNKEILRNLCVSEKILFAILEEFVSLDANQDQIIVSSSIEDFRYVDGYFPEDEDNVFDEDD
jgi:hypothetical protein